MSNIRFIIDNAIDIADLSTSTGVDSIYVEDNVKKISRSKPVRSAAPDVVMNIKGSLPTGIDQDISALVLAKHNFSSNVTYQLFLYSNDNFTSEIYDSGIIQVTSSQAANNLWQWGEFKWGSISWGASKTPITAPQFHDIVLWLSSTYTAKSFIIKIDIPGGGGTNPFYCNESSIYCNDISITCDQEYLGSGGGETISSNLPYFEIGRIYLGEYLEPQYNLSPKHNIYWNENTLQYRPSSGTLQSDFTTSNRNFEFSLLTIPEADRIVLHKKLISMGLRNDFYISIFPEDTSIEKEIDYSGSVKFTKVPKYGEFINNYYKSNFVVEEV